VTAVATGRGVDGRGDGQGGNMEKRGLLFLAWGAIPGRSAEIADSLGGSSICMYPPSSERRPPVWVRYLVCTLRTVAVLVRRQPAVVVVTNPPAIPGLIALAWARLRGTVVALDSHPGAFGAQDNRVGQLLLPVHRWLSRHVAVSLVAAPAWQAMVESWGGRAVVVHEAPAGQTIRRAVRHHPIRVLYVGTFVPDEPFEIVVDAAARMPECEVLVTGDPERCPPELRAGAPPNVRFIGFLDHDAYRQQLTDADVVITLTTEPASVMRAAYEATYAERLLILSDWPIARELFPYAVHTPNTGPGLAAALAEALEDFDALRARSGEARRAQERRWETQRHELAAALGWDLRAIAAPGAGRPSRPAARPRLGRVGTHRRAAHRRPSHETSAPGTVQEAPAAGVGKG